MKDPNIIKDEHIYILKKRLARYPGQEEIHQVIYKQQQGERFIAYN